MTMRLLLAWLLAVAVSEGCAACAQPQEGCADYTQIQEVAQEFEFDDEAARAAETNYLQVGLSMVPPRLRIEARQLPAVGFRSVPLRHPVHPAGALIEVAALQDQDDPAWLVALERAWKIVVYIIVVAVLLSYLSSWPSVQRLWAPPTGEAQNSKLWSSLEGGDPGIPEFRRGIDWILATRASEAPQKVALIDGLGTTMTYAALEDHIATLAADLADLCGIGEGDMVGMMTDRGFVELIGPMAALRALGAFCNLDITSPGEALKALCEQISPKVVLCSSKAVAMHLPAEVRAEVVSEPTFRLAASVSASDRKLQPPETRENTLAMVAITSGSSGTPKGVKMGQHYISSDNWNYVKMTGMSSKDTALVQASNFWGIWIQQVGPAIFTGGALKMLRAGGNKDVVHLQEVITQPGIHAVTALNMTAQVLDIIVSSIDPDSVPHLRHIVQVGEPCTVALAERVVTTLPHVNFYNLWGTTESSCCFWSSKVGPSLDKLQGDNMVAGRPYWSVVVRILDEDLKEVAPGAAGGVYVGGEIALGYLNDPELTAKKFISDPMQPGAKLYDTGDLGMVCPLGQMHILGRRDRQIKLRGIRMEPEGIETTIRSIPGVHRAAVVATKTPAILHAFVEVDKAAAKEVSEQSVLDFCEINLAVHQRPQRVVTLPAGDMPTLSNGKTNMRALQAEADQAKTNGEEGKEIVDSLGLMRQYSKQDLEIKRVMDNLLAVNTCLMVHYHVNCCGISLKDTWHPFLGEQLAAFSNFSGWVLLGFILAGAAMDARHEVQKYSFGIREVMLVYVYVVWGVTTKVSAGGARWYLGILIVCKVVLVGMHRLKLSLRQQLLLVLTMPVTLRAHREYILFENSGERGSVVDLPRMLEAKNLYYGALYCIIFLFYAEIGRATRVLLKANIAVPLAAFVGFLAIGAVARASEIWKVEPRPHFAEAAIENSQVALVFVMISGLPASWHFEWMARHALGAYIIASLWRWFGEPLTYPGNHGWEEFALDPIRQKDMLLFLASIGVMVFNIVLIFALAWPLQKLLLLPVHLFRYAADAWASPQIPSLGGKSTQQADGK